MRTKDGIFFSPNYRFIDINWNNPDNLIDAFEDRINGFYFEPAESLNETFQAFSKGLICISLIDLLSKIETNSDSVGSRYEFWLKKHFSEFNELNPDNQNQTTAYRFYKEFRNSLVHECMIANAGQFSYEYNKMIHFIRDENKHIMVINPEFLIISLQKAFNNYIMLIKEDESEYQSFLNFMRKNFLIDFESAYRGI